MPKFILNGQTVDFRLGMTILEVAREHGLRIPTLCHLPEVEATGICRICVVEVEGSDHLLPACATPAGVGMNVKTESPRVIEARRTILKMLVASGEHNCFVMDLPPDIWSNGQLEIMQKPWHEVICPAHGDCRLQDLVVKYDVSVRDLEPLEQEYPLDDDHPMIVRDFGRCIQCGRCILACNEVQVNQAIPAPYGWRVTRPQGWFPTVDYDYCTHCGECVQVCPVGALFEKKAFGLAYPNEMELVRTTCTYCGVGCQQWLHIKDDRILKVTGVDEARPNQGRLCVKGRFGYDFVHSEERLKLPLIREGNDFREASWEEALDLAAQNFTRIEEKHGPDALAGIGGAQSANEDAYSMQKFFRAAIGTNNVDHQARTRHGAAMAGLSGALGSGAMTNSLAEFKKAKSFFVIGADLVEAHPVAAAYVKQAVRNGARLIVVGPTNDDIAEHAQVFARIEAGSETAFINGLMNVLITEERYDKEYVESYTTGFEEMKAVVMNYPPERAGEISGVSPDLIRSVAKELAETKPAMLIHTPNRTGHTQEAGKMVSCANLQMLLGNMGLEGGGVNPMLGQNNVQGACDMGMLPDELPGHQKIVDPDTRRKFEQAWGMNLPEKPGLVVSDIIDGLGEGSIKALYILGSNIAATEPDPDHVEKCLKSAEFVVCNDLFPTETTRFAHVIFPAAAWSEVDGTFTNSERRVSRVRKAVSSPGEAQPNWWIFKEIARRMGQDWPSDNSRDIWDNEISALAPPFAGIKYSRIEGDGLQWPVPDADHPGTPILHSEGPQAGGLGKLTPTEWTPPVQEPSADHVYDGPHDHTRSLTARCEGFDGLLEKKSANMSTKSPDNQGTAHEGKTNMVS